MTVPHRDYTPTIIAWRPDYDDKTIPQPSRCDEAWLAVIPSLIGQGHDAPCENQLDVGEVKASFGEGGPPLGFVPSVHGFMYPQKFRRSTAIGSVRAAPSHLRVLRYFPQSTKRDLSKRRYIIC
jgi:hypothetical protein